MAPQLPAMDASTMTTRRCVTCGTHVTEQFGRVFGDNEGLVTACPSCSTFRELARREQGY